MKHLGLILCILTICHFGLIGQPISLHVSPQGDDQNDGTEAEPLATIERAQYLIREIRKQHVPNDTISVILHKGTYRLKQGIVLTADDAGTEKSPLLFCGNEGDKVTISGGIPICNTRPLSNEHPLYKKDPVTGCKIIEIDLLEAGLTLFKPLRLSGFSGQEAPKDYKLRELYFSAAFQVNSIVFKKTLAASCLQNLFQIILKPKIIPF